MLPLILTSGGNNQSQFRGSLFSHIYYTPMKSCLEIISLRRCECVCVSVSVIFKEVVGVNSGQFDRFWWKLAGVLTFGRGRGRVFHWQAELSRPLGYHTSGTDTRPPFETLEDWSWQRRLLEGK